MQRPLPLTFATLVSVPENRSALIAAQTHGGWHGSGRSRRRDGPNPLFLHGPVGSGKTHLASALADKWIRCEPTGVVTMLAAADWNALAAHEPPESDTVFYAVRHSDVFVLEDLQHLSPTGAVALVRIVDELLDRGVALVFTATVGPRRLGFSERLTSRLAGGLVVGLESLQAPSRLAVLQDKAQRRQLAASQAVLAWLAEHMRGGRQLDGAIVRLETLTRESRLPLNLESVANHFEQIPKPSLERIAQKVGAFFGIDLRQLRSARRRRHILLPRQICMYLARQLSGLTLEKIGAYFGGRDHTTVLHACRKVERDMRSDVVFSGSVRQLYLDLA